MSDTAELDSVSVRDCGRLGYPDIRPSQLEAGGQRKNHCVMVMLIALCINFDHLYRRESSIVIVVSPLISLMKDQVISLVIVILTKHVRYTDSCTEF